MICELEPYGNLKYKRVTVELSSLSSVEFSTTARSIGHVRNILGIPDSATIMGLYIEDATLSPAAILIVSTWGRVGLRAIYVAASQNTTLSSDIELSCIYTD